MEIHTLEKGQSLMEVLFAVTIFTITIVTLGYLSIDAQRSLVKNIQFEQAQLLASGGIEAVRTLRDYGFGELTAGTHGLALVNGVWLLQGTEEVVLPGFTRSITIEEVSSGVKEITSLVTWTDSSQVQRDVSFSSYITDWRAMRDDASFLAINTTAAVLSPSFDAITGISFENSGPNPITIVAMMVEWGNANTLSQVVIEGLPVFTSPLGEVSGSIIDIDDFVVTAGSGVQAIDQILFSDSMLGSAVTVTFIMSDDSQISEIMSF